MNGKKKVLLTVLSLGAAMGLIFSGCAPQSDEAFVRTAMEGLIKGEYSVRTRFDWPVLKFAGKDIGLEYSKYKSDKDREDYERAFINNFSSSYRKAGAKTSTFFNWRPFENAKLTRPNIRAVAANYRNEKYVFLFFLLEENMQRKISEVAIMKTVRAKDQARPDTKGTVTNEANRNL